MDELYSRMNSGGLDIREKDLFTIDSSSIKHSIKEYKVNIKKSDKTSQVFEMNGKTFTINVKKATRTIRDGLLTPSVNGFDFETFNEIQLELSDGTTTCKLNHIEKRMSEDLCNAENSESLETSYLRDDEDNIIKDSQGKELRYANFYRNTNITDFENCAYKLNND
jgi:hypothetical protein